jgi:D-alanyl-D-alanine carboxypeptidase
MQTRRSFTTLLLSAAACRRTTPATSSTGKGDDLASQLEEIRDRHGLPGLAAAAFDSKMRLGGGATGVRKARAATSVTLDDRWHLGSCTKAMTATLLAIFVERGKLRWEATLAEALPVWAGTMHPDYRRVSLEMLLQHRGGVPGNVPPDIWSELWKPGNPRLQRHQTVEEMLKRPPSATPGSRYLYSNAGYMVAGVMLEEELGDGWESLMRAHLFGPLEMSTAGFGAPATAPDQVDQPWAHAVTVGFLRPVAPGPASDNPPALGPAGTVHGSLGDWARFLAVHLRGARGQDGLVSAATIQRLHLPANGGDYAAGWVVTTRHWAGGPVLTHSGSNTLFHAAVWIAPAKDRILVAATNRGDDRASAGTDAAFGPLIAGFVR